MPSTEWRRANPETARATRVRERARHAERYRTDPEYREKSKAQSREYGRKTIVTERGILRGRSAKSTERYRAEEAYRLERLRLNTAGVAERRAFIDAIKATLACIRCGENDSACLDFHHRDRATKKYAVATLAGRRASHETILAEIAKCDALCANCHRKEHRGMHGRFPRR